MLRRLSPGRTRSRFGRLLATVLAILVSLLLVGTVGPVYAADSGTGGTSITSTAGAGALQQSAPVQQTAVTAATPAFDCSRLTTVGGFEVDGDVPVDCGGTRDWAGTGMHVADGAKDHSAYTQGDAENTPAAQWHDGGSSQGKDDITDAYGWTSTVDGDVWTLFGVGRVSDNGTTTYDIELNHNANLSSSPARPDRSTGDLLLQFSVNGNGPLTFDEAYQWTAATAFTGSGCFESGSTGYGWCPLDTVKKPAFASANSPDGLFAEGALNLSALGRANHGLCTGNFGVMNLRTVASEQHTAALQDYVAPFAMHVDSTCATLVIHKQDLSGDTVPGATFRISPTPVPGDSGDLLVTDGASTTYPGAVADGKADGLVTIAPANPDTTYTVTEVAAPDGYLLPATATSADSVGENGTVSFTFRDPRLWRDLTVSNTAQASYTRTYHWRLAKGVGDTESGPFTATDTKKVPDSATDTASFGYQVKAIEDGYADSARTVTGTLRITNPNDAAVTVHLADELSDATTCTFAESTVAVPGDNQPHDYGYTCAPSTTTATSSRASVTWSKADYPQSQADVGATGDYGKQPAAGFTWTQDAEHRTVTVTDDQYDLDSGGWKITYGEGTGTEHSTTYTREVTGAAGSCTDSRNTATLTADDDPGYTRSATATATLCVGRDLAVVKTASPTLTRTYDWQVTKTADQARITTAADGTATAGFTLHVRAGDYADSAWAMTGAVTVSNPNDWEDVELTGLTDWFDGGVDGHQTCVITDWSSVSHVVRAGSSRTYHYSCTFDQPPAYDGTNTATATWNGTAAATPDSTADGRVAVGADQWAEVASVHRTVDLFDDDAGSGAAWTKVNDVPIQWQAGLDRTFHYVLPVSVDPGTCRTFTNQARLMSGDVLVAGPAAASVTACNPQGLSVSKSADATFVRTYHWSIDKAVAAPSVVREPSYSHAFDYTVTATPTGYTDGHWALSGSIHVANPNSDDTIPPVTATVTDTPSGVGGGAVCTVNGGDDTVTLASGEAVDLPYTCTFTGTPGDGTNVATVSWPGGRSTGSAPVHFTQAGSVDQSMQVWDDQVGGPARLLGSATWGDQPTAFRYSQTLTAPSATCTDFVNHAWLTAVEGTDHLGEASATATICPVPGTWKVVKTSSPADGSTVLPGGDITYHVTVSKTGGVDPTGVVVEDDLGPVVDHTSDPVITAPPGTTASYDPVTHLLTWNVGTVSGALTLDYTVTVDDGAAGVTLVNQVTSEGSDNCSPSAIDADDCSTVHYTPHYSLAKSSSVAPGGTVMPPYLGAAGDTISYTLTAVNDSGGVVEGAVVTDDLSDVLDDATLVDGSIAPADQASVSGTTLTWHLPELHPGETAVLTYQVTVRADRWDEQLVNTATPDATGSCATDSGRSLCSTTAVTPPYTQLAVRKVDAETGAPLAGATFALAAQADPGVVLDTATSGADGVAVFGARLQPGGYLVTETEAPAGYDLPPAGRDAMPVTIQQPGADSNFVADAVMAPVDFRDLARGQLSIVKEQYRLAPDGSWQKLGATGTVAYGDQIKYVVKLDAAGPKLFHDVTVTDYVPGHDPADTTSTAPATLVPGSAVCTGSLTCTVSTDAATGLVTWSAGTVGGTSGAMVMVVGFPDLPGAPAFDEHGRYTTTLRNVAHLAWDEADATTAGPLPGPGDLPVVHRELDSNEVVASASYVESSPPVQPPHQRPHQGPPHRDRPPSAPPLPPSEPPHGAPPPSAQALPNTGGPQWWYLPSGLGLLLLGSGLLLGGTGRRRREA